MSDGYIDVLGMVRQSKEIAAIEYQACSAIVIWLHLCGF